MHVLYVHQNFPAQFGHIAQHLVKMGHRCTYISATPGGNVDGIEKIQYKVAGGATTSNHFCSRSFENQIWHCDGVYQTLKQRMDLKPDLIVGHSGFGSTLFLRELYGKTPIVNMLEWYYRPKEPDDDIDFRRDLGWKLPDNNYHRARARNAMLLLDLQNCDVGYCPTEFQRSRLPSEYQPKLRTLFDGIDRAIYHGYEDRLRDRRETIETGGVKISPSTRIVTYVSRGFESMRGFDIFMRAAKLIYQRYPDVVFVVVGQDRIAYGGDSNHLPQGVSFKQWVLSRESYDMSKFIFTGLMPMEQLAKLLATSDLHIYLTVPFVLSWSMMDAMSCGCVVLGSDTKPVREIIEHEKTGLLADFFSPEDFAEKAVEVLRDPKSFRQLGQMAEKMIAEKYSLDVMLPRHLEMYQSLVGKA